MLVLRQLDTVPYCLKCMQIGLKAEWRNAQGRMVLYVGNKHTGPLTNARSSVLPPTHLRMQSAVVPDTIPPRAQVCTSSVFNNSGVCDGV